MSDGNKAGRSPDRGEPKSKEIRPKITPTAFQKLEALCQQYDCSQQEMIERLIRGEVVVADDGSISVAAVKELVIVLKDTIDEQKQSADRLEQVLKTYQDALERETVS